MKRTLHSMAERLTRREQGFTLVELLVVVAIIVALGAAIIPNLGRFAGKGTQGAQVSEQASVQTAIDAMMADNGLSQITGHDGALDVPIADWAAFGDLAPTAGTALYNAAPTSSYLRENPTKFFYCWDITGTVYQIDNDGAGGPIQPFCI